MTEAERKRIIFDRLNSDWCLLSNKYDYTVVGVFLQGSQNYGLDDDESDIDTKAIILPTLKDLIFNYEPISRTITLNEKGEHIDVKDIREMFKMFKKQNSSYLELMFTPYKIVKPELEDLFNDYGEEIAHYDPWRCMAAMRGMVLEKYYALTKPRPSTEARIKKFGYDPKQLHHMLRLQSMMIGYSMCAPFESLLTEGFNRDYLLRVKRGKEYEKEEAIAIAKNCVDTVNEIEYKYKVFHEFEINKKIDLILDRVAYDLIEEGVIKFYEKE